MTSIDEKNRQRNANVKQNQDEQTKQQRDYFDQLGLTKRNAEYMFRFHRQFGSVKMDAEKKNQIVDDMIHELLENQKSGKNARNMYGTVEQKINAILNPPKQKLPISDNYWPNAVYNWLFFFAMFNVVYGLTFLFSLNQGAKNTGAAGIVTLLIISVSAGLGMPIMTRLFDANYIHKLSGMIRFLIMLAMFLGWLIIFFGAAVVPSVVNPILNPFINIGLAVISAASALYVKRHYNVTTSLFRSRG